MIIIRRLKFVRQDNNYDCGLACLLMIAKYYNCNVSKDYLEKVSSTTQDGTSMYGLLKAASSLGFNCYGGKGNVDALNSENSPFIAHIKINDSKNLYHYVVVNSIGNKKITIKDPSFGAKTMTKDEFSKISTGNFLFIKKTASIKKFVRRKVIKDEFFILLNKNKFSLILLSISVIISIFLEFLNMFSLKIILNNAILVGSFSNLLTLLIIFAYLLLLKTAFSYIINVYVLKISKKFNYKLKLNLIKHLLSLPNLYYQTKKKGVIVSLFTDVDTLSNYLFSSIVTFINSFLTLIFIYTFFISLSSVLALILFGSTIILFLFIYWQKNINSNLIFKYYQAKDSYDSKLQQIIINNERIKGLHLEDLMFKKFRRVTDYLESQGYAITKYSDAIKSSLSFLEGMVYLFILWVSGIILITTNKMTITTFLLLESLIFIALKNIESLILILLKYVNCKKIKERLNDIFNYQKEILLPFYNYEYVTKNLSITIRNLSFSYDDNLILDDINIKIKPKDKVFIYGKSGSGKSTLVKLLGRFLPASYGDIKLGNIDITHYNLKDLRNIVTYISAKDMISNGNIKDNIYLKRKPRINQNVLLKVTGVKQLLKDKNYTLDTVLMENGENISMGERSRISLAQALFKPSEIYILDECLSNVDVGLEKEILEKILNYYQDKIIIYISHRLTNKNLFNRVFYMEKGKCYEKI